MNIHALAVCVDYADLLRKGMENWKRGLDSLTVVTTPMDKETLKLCDAWGLTAYTTEVFYERGAKFNKGAAISEAFGAVEWPDWCLLFDADIIPPADWRQQIESHSPQIGNMYGARRELEEGWAVFDRELAGFFQLFHSTDPNAQQRPLVDTHWGHAGCYDSYFTKRWAPEQRIILPIDMIHQGLPGKNWCGRHNQGAMRDLMEERARRGSHLHERIDLP